jgi:hypothetical protein
MGSHTTFARFTECYYLKLDAGCRGLVLPPNVGECISTYSKLVRPPDLAPDEENVEGILLDLDTYRDEVLPEQTEVLFMYLVVCQTAEIMEDEHSKDGWDGATSGCMHNRSYASIP